RTAIRGSPLSSSATWRGFSAALNRSLQLIVRLYGKVSHESEGHGAGRALIRTALPIWQALPPVYMSSASGADRLPHWWFGPIRATNALCGAIGVAVGVSPLKHQWGLGGVVVQRRKSVGAAPRAGGRARVGRRMTHQVFLGLPWYLSDDYPALLALFS